MTQRSRAAIIAGGRDFRFRQEHRTYLADLRRAPGFDEVVCGCAPGADTEGEKWAMDHGIAVVRFPADWRKYGRSAGPRRNVAMAEHARLSDGLCVLFPGGAGTASMRQIALAAGLTVYAYPDLRPVTR